MDKNIVRNVPIAVATLFATSAFAAMDNGSRTDQLEKQMSQVRTETANKTYGAKTASGRPEVDGYGVYMSLDVLCWRARPDGTDFAYRDSNKNQSFPISSDMQEVTPGWDWGFRVGAGYNFQHDDWTVGLEYTYFRTNESSTLGVGRNDQIIPLRGASNITSSSGTIGSFTGCDGAKSRYSLDFDNLELQLSRNYHVSNALALRPFIGVQTAWIDQNQKTTYSEGDQLGVNEVRVNDKSDFWGIGPQVGAGSSWTLGHGFSFFGLLQGALVYGNHDVEHENQYSGNESQRVSLNGDIRRFAPSVRMNLGLRYGLYFDKGRQHISAALGYDAQYWFRQNQMLAVSDQATGPVVRYEHMARDLSFQGINVNLRWDF